MPTRRRKKKKASTTKRISAALTRYLRKMNPGKMKGVTHVRVKKLKGGGVTITPAIRNAASAFGPLPFFRPTRRKAKRKRNIAEGYMAGGVFHPIRASYDYNVMRAGEGTKTMRLLTGGGKKKKRKRARR